MSTHNRESGRSGEDLAVDFVIKKGYRILERNFRFDRGEIDIVADDHGMLVFIEVKARHTKRFGEPEEAVSVRKRAQLRKVAEGYLFLHRIDDVDCRFDVIAIEYERNIPVIRHIDNAF
ncbi:MAG: YraN family protein [Ignavibacteriae bacterium]|nr:YraN family protein [Ignavibacteria bacterium]MBI3363609.1 YraN family protein [Ignavibacteriota bacterium]